MPWTLSDSVKNFKNVIERLLISPQAVPMRNMGNLILDLSQRSVGSSVAKHYAFVRELNTVTIFLMFGTAPDS